MCRLHAYEPFQEKKTLKSKNFNIYFFAPMDSKDRYWLILKTIEFNSSPFKSYRPLNSACINENDATEWIGKTRRNVTTS